MQITRYLPQTALCSRDERSLLLLEALGPAHLLGPHDQHLAWHAVCEHLVSTGFFHIVVWGEGWGWKVCTKSRGGTETEQAECGQMFLGCPGKRG